MRNTNIKGVYEDRGKIFTKNSIKGVSVYGERLFSDQGSEYRQWDPKRSKLGAAILKRVDLPKFLDTDTWLYLGCASGTTVSHISDMLTKGFIYGVDFAPRVIRDFLFMSEKRKNIIPILGDAFHPETYESKVTLADVLFQDIAQKNQVEIFLRNMKLLKHNGYAILSLKARSIDVAKKPRQVFEQVRKELTGKVTIIDYKTLEPYEADHAIFVCRP